MLQKKQAPISVVVSLLLALTSEVTNGSPIIARGGVLVKEEAQVAFSETTWTLACPVWINETDSYISIIKNWANKQLF